MEAPTSTSGDVDAQMDEYAEHVARHLSELDAEAQSAASSAASALSALKDASLLLTSGSSLQPSSSPAGDSQRI